MADPDSIFNIYAEVIMKVSSTVNLRSETSAVESVHQSVDVLLKTAFEKAKAGGKLTSFENTLFIYMGLLKVRFCIRFFFSDSISINYNELP